MIPELACPLKKIMLLLSGRVFVASEMSTFTYNDEIGFKDLNIMVLASRTSLASILVNKKFI